MSMIQKVYMDKIVEDIAKRLSRETIFTFEDVKKLYMSMFYDDVRKGEMEIGRSIDATSMILSVIMFSGGTVEQYINTIKVAGLMEDKE